MKFKPANIFLQGYTLVEVLIVIGMIVVISAITITIINPARQRDRVSDAVLKESVEKIASAMEVYKSIYGDYPSDQATAGNLSRYIGEGYTVYIADGIIAFNNTSLETGNQASSVYWDYTNQCLQAQSSEDPTKYISWIPGGNVNIGTNCGDDSLASTITDDVGPTTGTTVTYVPTSGGSGGSGTGVTPALIANYKLDEKSGIIVNDSTTNHYNGSLINVPEWIDGVNGTAVDFIGPNQYAQISGLLGRPASITITAWVNIKVTPSSYGYEIFSVGDIAALRVRPGDIYGFYYSYTTAGEPSWLMTRGSPSIIGSGWTHLAYTVNTIDHVQKLYVNGSLRATTSYTQSIRYSDLGTKTYIGRHGDGSAYYNLNGAVDNVKVYNYALTQEQVNEDMEFSPPTLPKVRFKFEETTGDIAYDASGNRNRGNIGGSSTCPGAAACPVSTIGKSGNAFDFDGDSYVELPATAASGLDLAENHEITVMAWVRPDVLPTDSSTYSYIAARGYDGTKEGFYLRFQGLGAGQTVLRFGSYDASGGSDHAATWTLGPTDIIPGTWYHIAGTYDGSSWNIYVDGQLKISSPSPYGPEKNSKNITVGSLDHNGTMARFLDGAIDDVKIYDFAMDQDEINSSK